MAPKKPPLTLVRSTATVSPPPRKLAKPGWSCDIWALAVVTHEMLTGQRPFFSRDGGLVDSFLEGLPGCFRDFFNWSLAREPSQRPETVDAFLERFERCAATVLGHVRGDQG